MSEQEQRTQRLERAARDLCGIRFYGKPEGLSDSILRSDIKAILAENRDLRAELQWTVKFLENQLMEVPTGAWLMNQYEVRKQADRLRKVLGGKP